MQLKNVVNIQEKTERIYASLRRACLGTNELEEAAALAEFAGAFAHQNFIGLYHDLPIEEHIRSLARILAGSRSVHRAEASISGQVVLHVMTTAYAAGGHTRVVERLCQAEEPGYAHRVIITHQGDEALPDRLATDADELYLVQPGSYADRSVELAKRLADADLVVLHIHAHDVLPMIAAELTDMQGKKVALYNHADHAFTLGYSVADFVFEISGFGYELSRQKKTDGLQRIYLGIPLGNDESVPVRRPDQSAGYLLSAGTAYKYLPVAGLDFIAFAERLAERVQRKFLVIGPDRRKEPAWQAAFERSEGRVDAIGGLPFEDYLEKVRGAACYVDSFPMTGGTVYPEVLLAGTPVFGLRLSCSGYSCLDVLREPTVEALVDAIDRFLGDEQAAYLERLSDLQGKLLEFQSLDAVFQRLVRSARTPSSASEGLPYPYDEQRLSHFEGGWRDARQIHVPHKALSEMKKRSAARLFSLFAFRVGWQPVGLFRLIVKAFF